MTNITTTVIITLSTNWTGIISDWNNPNSKELGFMMTNHTITTIYMKQTNIHTVSFPSTVALWRVPSKGKTYFWTADGTNQIHILK